MSTESVGPQWEHIAESLERQAAGPTGVQLRTAAMLHIELPEGIPAPVAAIVLQEQLKEALYLPKR